jgi:protein translocase SecG subunit
MGVYGCLFQFFIVGGICATIDRVFFLSIIMRIVLLVVQIIVMIFMIGLILLQKGESVVQGGHGKTGASGLVKTTAALAGVFFINCIALARIIRNESVQQSRAIKVASQQEEKASSGVQQPAPADLNNQPSSVEKPLSDDANKEVEKSADTKA